MRSCINERRRSEARRDDLVEGRSCSNRMHTTVSSGSCSQSDAIGLTQCGVKLIIFTVSTYSSRNLPSMPNVRLRGLDWRIFHYYNLARLVCSSLLSLYCRSGRAT